MRSEQECSEAVTHQFEELHISVTPFGEDRFLVRTEHSPKGVLPAEEQVIWPVEQWLQEAAYLMDDPLVGLLRRGVVGPVREKRSTRNVRGGQSEGYTSIPGMGRSHGDSPGVSPNLVDFGQQLYEQLFQGSLRDRLSNAQAIAHNRGNLLRLRLGVKGDKLPRLPWEVLHEDLRPIATGKDIVFSRYQPNCASLNLPHPTGEPLRILMVLSAPTDRDNLALKQEAMHLREELQKQWRGGTPGRGKPPKIELTLLEQPNREKLTQALEQNQYQVFHYSGHSTVAAGGGQLYLVNDKTGLTEFLTGDDLAGLLVNNGIRMAVFNSCRGSHSATDLELGNGSEGRTLAEVLVRRGIPGVLAMAERIPDDVALILTRLFYRNIKQGYPVDLSLNRARQGLISTYGSGQLYWALPVLYLHPEFDGYLVSQNGSETTGRDVPLQKRPTAVGKAPEEATSPPMSGLALKDKDDRHELAPLEYGEADLEPEEEEDLDAVCRDLAKEDDESAADIQNLFREIVVVSGSEGKAAAAVAPAPTPKEPEPKRPRPALSLRWCQSSFWKSKGVATIASLGVLAIALLGGWTAYKQGNDNEPQPGEFLPYEPLDLPQHFSPELVQTNLSTAPSRDIAGLAIEQFNRGQLLEAQAAIEELLKPERSALVHASAALAAVPPQQQDEPRINFLRGRLAWQSLHVGDPKYSLDDVRRYWQRAVEQQPQYPAYRNALAFAYYADGQLEQAQINWFKALKSLENLPVDTSPVNQGGQPIAALTATGAITTPLESPEALTAYAGLALVEMKLARTQSLPQQEKLLSRAIEQRQYILLTQPTAFQPDALGKNWMWPEQAVQDWRSLLQLQQKAAANPGN
nr:CHAT domain-containing protein [Oxynema sp. CENA135]